MAAQNASSARDFVHNVSHNNDTIDEGELPRRLLHAAPSEVALIRISVYFSATSGYRTPFPVSLWRDGLYKHSLHILHPAAVDELLAVLPLYMLLKHLFRLVPLEEMEYRRIGRVAG